MKHSTPPQVSRMYQYLMYFLAGLMFLGFGGVMLLIPRVQRNAEQAEQTRQALLQSGDLDATVNARLTLRAEELNLQATATAFLEQALLAARTQAIQTEAAISGTLFAQATQAAAAIESSATAAPRLTEQVLLETATAQVAAQSTATRFAEFAASVTAAAELGTRSAQIATLSAAETALVESDTQRRATAEAMLSINSTREAALGTAGLLNESSAAQLRQLALFRHGAPLTDLEVSLDGSLAAAISGSDILLWDVRGGKLLRTLNHAGLTVNGLAFSPDGRRLAAGVDDGSVWLWHMRDPSPPLIKQGHRQPVFQVAFSIDGSLLGSAGGDKAIIWDVARMQPVTEILGFAWEVYFSPLGRTVYVAGADGVLRVWGVPIYGPSATPTVTPSATLLPTRRP